MAGGGPSRKGGMYLLDEGETILGFKGRSTAFLQIALPSQKMVYLVKA